MNIAMYIIQFDTWQPQKKTWENASGSNDSMEDGANLKTKYFLAPKTTADFLNWLNININATYYR